MENCAGGCVGVHRGGGLALAHRSAHRSRLPRTVTLEPPVLLLHLRSSGVAVHDGYPPARDRTEHYHSAHAHRAWGLQHVMRRDRQAYTQAAACQLLVTVSPKFKGTSVCSAKLIFAQGNSIFFLRNNILSRH